MIDNWDEMDYWSSGEWQVVQEKLDDLDKTHPDSYCPRRENMFADLDAVPFKDVKVAIFGQDPYPSKKYATGMAFSIPKDAQHFPPTLKVIFDEYCKDLNYEMPTTGNLDKWVKQGILLHNVIPTCNEGNSLSHNWEEYKYLNDCIISNLKLKGDVVFVFLGAKARAFARYLLRDKTDKTKETPWGLMVPSKGIVEEYREDTYDVLEFSHPSPRANRVAINPFIGSRMFTRINEKLKERGKQPIDWRL